MISNLATTQAAYVTTGELAEYWRISRRMVYKQIQAGTLRAVQFGPRLWRVKVEDAREFEASAKLEAR